jgi:hypothetical protein
MYGPMWSLFLVRIHVPVNQFKQSKTNMSVLTSTLDSEESRSARDTIVRTNADGGVLPFCSD